MPRDREIQDGGAVRRQARLGIGYRRAIGENGDLFLFAPAILAPVGPLTGVFFDGITLR